MWEQNQHSVFNTAKWEWASFLVPAGKIEVAEVGTGFKQGVECIACRKKQFLTSDNTWEEKHISSGQVPDPFAG